MKLYNVLTIKLFLLCFLMACSNMNDFHDQYLNKGEIIYTGRIDSAKVFPGRNRIMLRYWSSDPKAKKILFYWSFRSDSLLLDIPDKEKKDSVDVIISNLEEGNINLEIFTMNENLNNRSVAYNLTSNVYGDKYSLTLRNRPIRTILSDPVIGTVFYWSSAVQNSIGNKITYKNNAGKTVSRLVSSNENKTVIDEVMADITYQTAYLPTENAIDTFYSEVKTIDLGGFTGETGVPRLTDAYVEQGDSELRFVIFVEGQNVDKGSFLLRSVGKEITGSGKSFFQSGNFWYLNGGTTNAPNMSILPKNPLNKASARGVFVTTFDTSEWANATYTFEYGWHNRPAAGAYTIFLKKDIIEIRN